MKTAIVTGASSGLGIEFVNSIIRQRPEIEKIWVIARRPERLETLVKTYGDRIVPFCLDLTDDSSLEEYEKKIKADDPEICLLVNNAGSGTLGDLRDMDPAVQGRMVDLNVKAVTVLTTITLKYMKKGAVIINTCSIASFAPNPRMTVYCSTKAFILSFSKSLRFEEKKNGINVLAVCPGPMDTEFLPIAGIEKGSSHTFDTLPRCDPANVADTAIKKAYKGVGVYTPKIFYKFYRIVAKILPHGIVMKMSKA